MVPGHRTFTEQEQDHLLRCKVIDHPGSLHDPYCHLPADPRSLKYGEKPMCTEHLTDYIREHL